VQVKTAGKEAFQWGECYCSAQAKFPTEIVTAILLRGTGRTRYRLITLSWTGGEHRTTSHGELKKGYRPNGEEAMVSPPPPPPCGDPPPAPTPAKAPLGDPPAGKPPSPSGHADRSAFQADEGEAVELHYCDSSEDEGSPAPDSGPRPGSPAGRGDVGAAATETGRRLRSVVVKPAVHRVSYRCTAAAADFQAKIYCKVR